MEEIDNDRFASKPADQHTAIEFREARFAWDSIRRAVNGKRSEDPASDGHSKHQQNDNDMLQKKNTLNNESQLNGRPAEWAVLMELGSRVRITVIKHLSEKVSKELP